MVVMTVEVVNTIVRKTNTRLLTNQEIEKIIRAITRRTKIDQIKIQRVIRTTNETVMLIKIVLTQTLVLTLMIAAMLETVTMPMIVRLTVPTAVIAIAIIQIMITIQAMRIAMRAQQVMQIV